MPVSELKVPTSTVASLIGSKGQKVTDINQSSGASVSFDSANANSVFTTAYIRGNEEQTKKAIAIVKISVLQAKSANFVPVNRSQCAQTQLTTSSQARSQCTLTTSCQDMSNCRNSLLATVAAIICPASHCQRGTHSTQCPGENTPDRIH